MPVVVPNLHFMGNCAEAMALYARAFGAKQTVLLRYEDADARDFDKPLTGPEQMYVYHAEMELCGQRIMLSDSTDVIPSGADDAVSLTVIMETGEQVEKAYACLREGAAVIHPLSKTTYSGRMVSLRDRFGIRWGIMTET